MANDDRAQKPDDDAADDPWADIDSEPAAAAGDETFAFSFDESLEATPPAEPDATLALPAETIAGRVPEVIPAAEPDAELPAEPAPPADDAADDGFAESWLDHAAEVEASSSESADDPAGDQAVSSESTIRIGSGTSGIAAEGGDDPEAWPTDDTTDDDEPQTIAFDPAAAGAAVAAAAPVAAARRRAKGGLGQVAGIVGGGALSIPIVVGILLWGFQRDPFGAAKVLPSFLLPAKFRGGAAAGGPSSSPSLDDASAQAAKVLSEPVVEPQPDAPDGGAVGADAAAPADMTNDETSGGDAAAADGSDAAPATDGGASTVATAATEPNADPDLTPAPSEPPAVEPPADVSLDPAVDPAIAGVADEPGADEPMADEPGDAAVTAFVPPAAPEPLDFAGLDGAVASARETLDVAASIEATAGPAHDRGLVAWYRSLAGVGAELVALETEAVESGRSSADAAERLAALREEIAAVPALADDLERLARNWLDYGRRDSDGVVLPVTFTETRKVGPNWYSTVQLAAADGGSREVAVVSRREPGAVAGDRLLVLGVLFDDGVVYAAEIAPLSTESEGGGFFGSDGL